MGKLNVEVFIFSAFVATPRTSVSLYESRTKAPVYSN